MGDGLKRGGDTLYYMFVTHNTPTSLSCSWEMDSSRGPGRLFPDNVIKYIRNWNPSLEQYICRRQRHVKWKSLLILGASRFLMIVNTHSRETKLSARRLNSSQRAKFNTYFKTNCCLLITKSRVNNIWSYGTTMKHELNTD